LDIVTDDRAVRKASDTYHRIYAVVRQIPPGKVATYGDVASLAGLPRQARLVGYALHALSANSEVPWHRVINAKGGISTRHARPGADIEQLARLRAEGIKFNSNGRTSLPQVRWRRDSRDRTTG
jgi:methylated-DNA-protein-cysteine methyltransferase-like protein